MTEYYRPDYTPEWFHLENYEPLRKMDRDEIFVTMASLRGAYNDLINESLIELPSYYNYETEEMEEGEVFSTYPFEFLELLEKGEPIKKPYDKIWNKTSINPFNMSDYLDMKNAVESDKEKYNKKTLRENIEIVAPRGLSSLFSPDPAVTIKLMNDDEKILNDFKKWLELQREQRKPANNEKRLSKTAIDKLIMNRIIPCMHLLIWGQAKDIRYTDAQLRAMIFPDGVCSSDRQMWRHRKKALEYLKDKVKAFSIR